MNLFFVIQSILFFSPPLDLYSISFADIDGEEVKMSAFKGKRVLVATVDAPNVSKSNYRYLDSIQNVSADLQVIIVPAINSFRNKGLDEVGTIRRSIKSGIIFSTSFDVKKDGEKYQHPLFQWLTNSDHNGHFNIDGRPGQYYVISGKGTLYAVLQQGAAQGVLEDVLQTQFDESREFILNPETNFYESKQ